MALQQDFYLICKNAKIDLAWEFKRNLFGLLNSLSRDKYERFAGR
jgi:hypothetical protein